MTASGLAALEEEFRHLKNNERPAISKAIGIAREHGDLKENAEYHAAKERQGMIEARLKNLEGIISCAEVINPKTLSGDRVQFGATIYLADEDSEEEECSDEKDNATGSSSAFKKQRPFRIKPDPKYSGKHSLKLNSVDFFYTVLNSIVHCDSEIQQ